MIHRLCNPLRFLLPVLVLLPGLLFAQADPGTEPELANDRRSNSPYASNLRLGGHFNIVLSNFGFAMGGQLERSFSPVTSGLISVYATGLRDVSEQTFQNVFGQQFIPNKFNRIAAISVMAGFKRRLFHEQLADNFRFHVLGSAGIAPAFVYPYFRDTNGNGIWDPFTDDNPVDELIYDPLQGWNQGSWKMGASGEFGLGVDFGGDFESVTGIFFGAMFYYYNPGIQVLEPYSFDLRGNIIEDAAPRKLFISPVIRFSFGQNWKTKK